MSGQTAWAMVIVAVVAAAVIGFFLGRVSANGARQRTRELEAELKEQKQAVDAYRREVETHFDKTANLFVSMAGSYKELFEHLSSGYARLSDGDDKDLFRQRVATMLLDGPKESADQTLDSESNVPAEGASSDAEQKAAEQQKDMPAAAGRASGGAGKEDQSASEAVADSAAASAVKAGSGAGRQQSPEAQKESEIRATDKEKEDISPEEEAAAKRAVEASAKVDQTDASSQAGPAAGRREPAEAAADRQS